MLHGLAFNPQGELFIADIGSNRIVRYLFDSEGNPVSNGEVAASSGPIGVAFSPTGELFVTTHYDGSIYRFLFDGSGTAIPNGFIEQAEYLGGVAIFDRSRAGWFEDFEPYATGSFPSANWTNSGNAAATIEAGSGLSGSQSLKLFGVLGDC